MISTSHRTIIIPRHTMLPWYGMNSPSDALPRYTAAYCTIPDEYHWHDYDHHYWSRMQYCYYQFNTANLWHLQIAGVAVDASHKLLDLHQGWVIAWRRQRRAMCRSLSVCHLLPRMKEPCHILHAMRIWSCEISARRGMPQTHFGRFPSINAHRVQIATWTTAFEGLRCRAFPHGARIGQTPWLWAAGVHRLDHAFVHVLDPSHASEGSITRHCNAATLQRCNAALHFTAMHGTMQCNAMSCNQICWQRCCRHATNKINHHVSTTMHTHTRTYNYLNILITSWYHRMVGQDKHCSSEGWDPSIRSVTSHLSQS